MRHYGLAAIRAPDQRIEKEVKIIVVRFNALWKNCNDQRQLLFPARGVLIGADHPGNVRLGSTFVKGAQER